MGAWRNSFWARLDKEEFAKDVFAGSAFKVLGVKYGGSYHQVRDAVLRLYEERSQERTVMRRDIGEPSEVKICTSMNDFIPDLKAMLCDGSISKFQFDKILARA